MSEPWSEPAKLSLLQPFTFPLLYYLCEALNLNSKQVRELNAFMDNIYSKVSGFFLIQINDDDDDDERKCLICTNGSL